MDDIPPPKVIAGEKIVCLEGHEVGVVLDTVPLSRSILAGNVLITGGEVLSRPPRQRIECRQCRNSVARIDDRERWTVRLERGWVR